MNYAERVMPDGRTAEVIPLTFDRARLVIGWPEDQAYDDGW